MNGVDLGRLGDPQDLVDRQIGFDRPHLLRQMRPLADQVGLVGLEAVQRQLVLLGIDRDGLQAELVGGAEDADGDFGAIGDEKLLDGWQGRNSLIG